jgi:hypothetical protein
MSVTMPVISVIPPQLPKTRSRRHQTVKALLHGGSQWRCAGQAMPWTPQTAVHPVSPVGGIGQSRHHDCVDDRWHEQAFSDLEAGVQFQESLHMEAPHDVRGAAVFELAHMRERPDADVE